MRNKIKPPKTLEGYCEDCKMETEFVYVGGIEKDFRLSLSRRKEVVEE